MSELPPVQSPQSSRRRTLLWTVLGILAFLILAPILALVIWRASLTSKVNRELTAIRALGLPTSPVELDAFYVQVPDAENAALLYVEAGGMLPTVDREDQKLQSQFEQLGRREPLPASITNYLAQRLSENKDALEILHRAAGLTNSRYPVDLNFGFQTLLPHLGKGKETVRLLREEAVHEAAAGRADRATASVLAGYAAARSLASEPLLISYLVGVAMNAITSSGLEQVVNRVALDDAQLQRLQKAILSGDNTKSLPRVLAGERGCSIGVFKDPAGYAAMMNNGAGGGGGPSPGLAQGGPKALNSLTGFFDRDLLFYLKTMQKLIDSSQLPPLERFDALKSFDDDMVEARRKFYVMTAMIMPALGRCVDRDAENSARLRTAATALAVERYRFKHGGILPETLSALVPESLPAVPIDPFTGEALGFRKQGKGFVVYSVGADRQDDGGATTPKKKGANGASPADICFTVER